MFGRKKEQKQRSAAGAQKIMICDPQAYDLLCVSGYTSLAQNPEVQMAVNYIADLVSSMTIHLMRNTAKGDIREKNELSKKVDINPYSLTTRKTWMYGIVKNMLIEGNQIVYPQTTGGFLDDLIPLAPGRTSLVQDGASYKVLYGGREYRPDEVLHFLINPDPNYPWRGMGYRAALKEVVGNLKQAAATKKGFMESKWKPSLIIKVDTLADEFSDKAGRKKLLKEYVETSGAGEPLVLPAESFEVEQIKPLSLNDLAINDTVQLDKKTVAGIIGVPPHVVGAGDFDKEEHRNFINTKIMPVAQIVEQVLTKGLLVSPDRYFKLSSRALYGYDMQELSSVGQELYVRGIMTGNEVRDWLNMPPMDGLDERVILENYIPAGMIGEQKKLNPKGGQESGTK